MYHLKGFRGTLGSARGDSPLRLMGQMPKTWTMRSHQATQERQFWAGCSTSQMFLITLQKAQHLTRKLLNRATSVYVTDRGSAHASRTLSNGICSLNPNVDRLTQFCHHGDWSPHGKVVKHTITQTVINTTFRMTYSDVNDILAGDEEKAKPLRKLSQVFTKWLPCTVVF